MENGWSVPPLSGRWDKNKSEHTPYRTTILVGRFGSPPLFSSPAHLPFPSLFPASFLSSALPYTLSFLPHPLSHYPSPAHPHFLIKMNGLAWLLQTSRLRNDNTVTEIYGFLTVANLWFQNPKKIPFATHHVGTQIDNQRASKISTNLSKTKYATQSLKGCSCVWRTHRHKQHKNNWLQ